MNSLDCGEGRLKRVFANFVCEAKHSLLWVQSTEKITDAWLYSLREGLSKGIKVFLFLDGEDEISGLDEYKKQRLLQVYSNHEFDVSRLPESFYLLDGKLGDQWSDHKDVKLYLDVLGKAYENFNMEQFIVEHASPKRHLSIEAGAGTGKTTVMVQRILFLIRTTDVTLQEIAMITFTREAAKNMFHKLRDELHTLHKISRKVQYLEWMEQLSTMRISTIHSFAKSLIRELGAVLGYGKDVSIRQFGMERKKVIEKFLNDYLRQRLSEISLSEVLNGRLYKFINQVVDYWSEMERKGFTSGEIEKMDWGSADGKHAEVQKLFKDLFVQCERAFQDTKESANAVSLSDLTRQIDAIAQRQAAFDKLAQPIRYLFVDEFQDTDDSQIRLAITLHNAFKAKLFVVGDIKQSIYRFRGANHTAFQKLYRLMLQNGSSIGEPLPLNKNYRSVSNLLNELNSWFEKWGRDGNLPFDNEKDRLKGMKEEAFSLKTVRITEKKQGHPRFIAALLEARVRASEDYQRALALDPKVKHPRVAIIVRTNYEAKQIKNWCEEKDVYPQVDVGGTFFIGDAVQDFAALVAALLYPNDPVCQLNAFVTPYTSEPIPWSVLPEYHGDASRLLEMLKSQKNVYWRSDEAQANLREKPLLSALRTIIEKSKVVSQYGRVQFTELSKTNQDFDQCMEEATRRAKKYDLNLNRLFELLHQRFSDEFLTLSNLYQWLRINRSINRDEDEVELDEIEQGDRVRILTVHKSKGLEFHTVIVPFTGREFTRDSSEILFEKSETDTEPVQVGWQWKTGKSLKNENYNRLSELEKDETVQEETRLFYVALTRAEKHLYVFNEVWRKRAQNNWSMLLPKEEVALP